MRIPRLYTPQPLSLNSTGELADNTAHYVKNVLRMEAGRAVILFNGDGIEYTANLLQVGKRTVAFEVTDCHALENNRESSLQSHLAIGVSRGDRMDFVLQKATELGVSEITPIFTSRTEVKLSSERLKKKLQHWQQVIISACEQSQRTQLPTLNLAVTLSDFLIASADSNAVHNSNEDEKDNSCKLLLHPGETNFSIAQSQKQSNVVLLIGPEGGFSEEEVSQAKQHDFQTWVLGPRILRTETAPVAALAVLQQMWGDF